jgi:hypothetical protein
MNILPVSTAETLLVGPIVSNTDGYTPYTVGLVKADILLWKEGGTSIAAKNEANDPTHRSSGFWTVPVNATDTGTLGMFSIIVAKTGYLPFRKDYMVVPNLVYNALVNGTGNGIRASVQDMAALVITSASIAADAITAAKVASDVSTEIAAAVKATVVETNASRTVGDVLSLIYAATCGVTTTGGTIIKDPSGTTTRITASIDGSNNRFAMAVVPSA